MKQFRAKTRMDFGINNSATRNIVCLYVIVAYLVNTWYTHVPQMTEQLMKFGEQLLELNKLIGHTELSLPSSNACRDSD